MNEQDLRMYITSSIRVCLVIDLVGLLQTVRSQGSKKGESV